MSTAASTLIARTRRLLQDYPEEDVLSASVASTATSLTVADGTLYTSGWLLEIDQEVLYCNGTPAEGSTTVNVRRGLRSSTAASHASSATVLIQPRFFSIQILDALNEAMDACFPLLYRPVSSEYTGIEDTTYEYTLPQMSGLAVAIPYITGIEVQESGDTAFRKINAFEIRRSESPFIKFRRPLTAGSTIRISGYGPFTHLASVTDTLDTYFPQHAEYLLPLFAASQLLASGEAYRVRNALGVVDSRENANAVGASLKAAESLRNRFYTQLSQAAMPPQRKHVLSII